MALTLTLAPTTQVVKKVLPIDSILLTTHYSLLTTYCLPLTTHYRWSRRCCPSTAYYTLLTTHYLLLTTYCSLQVVKKVLPIDSIVGVLRDAPAIADVRHVT